MTRLDVRDRAARYLATLPPAIAGQGGHLALLRAASAMRIGFDLPEGTACDLIWTDFNPRCQPPWTPAEVRHKVRTAGQGSGARAPGYLLNDGGKGCGVPSGAARPVAHALPDLPPIDAASFHAIAACLCEACPLDADDAGDVLAYVNARALVVAGASTLAALPRDPARVLARLRSEFSEEGLAAAGLVDERGRLKAPRHRLIIPWRTRDGRIGTLQRRQLGPGEPRYVFPAKLPAVAPFGVELLDGADPAAPVMFCEGALDALALRQLVRARGLARVVLGLPGVHGWRPRWARLAAGRECIVATDADDAGDKVAREIALDCQAAGAASVRRLRGPDGLDWCGVLARGHGLGAA